MSERITIKTFRFLSISLLFIEGHFFIVTKCLPRNCIRYFTLCAKTVGFRTTSGYIQPQMIVWPPQFLNASNTSGAMMFVPNTELSVSSDKFYCVWISRLSLS